MGAFDESSDGRTGWQSGRSATRRWGDVACDDAVISACAGFIAAHTACVASNPEATRQSVLPATTANRTYRQLSIERAAALRAIRRYPAASLAGLSAKRDVLSKVIDWLGHEDPAVTCSTQIRAFKHCHHDAWHWCGRWHITGRDDFLVT